jgi:hypothetical protein
MKDRAAGRRREDLLLEDFENNLDRLLKRMRCLECENDRLVRDLQRILMFLSEERIKYLNKEDGDYILEIVKSSLEECSNPSQK